MDSCAGYPDKLNEWLKLLWKYTNKDSITDEDIIDYLVQKYTSDDILVRIIQKLAPDENLDLKSEARFQDDPEIREIMKGSIRKTINLERANDDEMKNVLGEKLLETLHNDELLKTVDKKNVLEKVREAFNYKSYNIRNIHKIVKNKYYVTLGNRDLTKLKSHILFKLTGNSPENNKIANQFNNGDVLWSFSQFSENKGKVSFVNEDCIKQYYQYMRSIRTVQESPLRDEKNEQERQKKKVHNKRILKAIHLLIFMTFHLRM